MERVAEGALRGAHPVEVGRNAAGLERVAGAEDAAGSLVGYALTTITPLLHANGSSAHLQELVVDNSHRGEGVGTAIVEEVERVCREHGVKQITVASRRSADFYERIGYRSSSDFLKRTF